MGVSPVHPNPKNAAINALMRPRWVYRVIPVLKMDGVLLLMFFGLGSRNHSRVPNGGNHHKLHPLLTDIAELAASRALSLPAPYFNGAAIS